MAMASSLGVTGEHRVLDDGEKEVLASPSYSGRRLPEERTSRTFTFDAFPAALGELGYAPSDETPRLPPDIMSRMVANRPDGGELSIEIQRHDDGRAAVKLTMEGELAGDPDDTAAVKEYTTAGNAVARDFFVALSTHLGD